MVQRGNKNMAILTGEPVRVYIETKDGAVREITGHVISVSISPSYSDMVEATFSVLSDNISFLEPAQMSDVVNDARTAKEWRCPHCGNVNPRSARYCGAADSSMGCRAARPFLYS